MGPRVHDMEVKDLLDIILKIKAGAYSFEAANPRHEHEWKIWGNAKLPKDKVLIPGVISHSTVLVEHPELVAERIARYACLVGKESVIAGSDCGFATFAGRRRFTRASSGRSSPRWRRAQSWQARSCGGRRERKKRRRRNRGAGRYGGQRNSYPAGSTSSARKPPIGELPRLSAPP